MALEREFVCGDRAGLHGVWLATVLVHASVHRVDDIRADGCLRSMSVVVQPLFMLNCAAMSAECLVASQALLNWYALLQIRMEEICSQSRIAKSRRTDLEDIGDGDGVLGGLALGGDDSNRWPGHGVSCGRCCC
jgi:hypothetical protein